MEGGKEGYSQNRVSSEQRPSSPEGGGYLENTHYCWVPGKAGWREMVFSTDFLRILWNDLIRNHSLI